MWSGLVTIKELNHYRENELLYSYKNLKNILHDEGEKFMLEVCFGLQTRPLNYYFGLDARSSLSADDTLSTIQSEPSINGYQRQFVTSSSFETIEEQNGTFQINSPIITFRSDGGSWGPVTNFFLSTSPSSEGLLISSVRLPNSTIVANSEFISLQLGLSLRDSTS